VVLPCLTEQTGDARSDLPIDVPELRDNERPPFSDALRREREIFLRYLADSGAVSR
jgi:hypothetical protein